MKLLLAAVQLAAIQAGSTKLHINWKDCGEGALAKVTDVNPKTLVTGSSTHVAGSGDLSEAVKGGTYTLDIKALGKNVAHCEGDAATDRECDIKVLGIKGGSVTYKALKFPVAAGHLDGEPSFDVNISEHLPKAAFHTSTRIVVKNLEKKEVFCVEVDTAPESALEQL